MPQRHCYFRGASKFTSAVETPFASESSNASGYFDGTSLYWQPLNDENVDFYADRVTELWSLYNRLEISEQYENAQDAARSCPGEFDPELFNKYRYQLVLPYLPVGTAGFDGYPWTTLVTPGGSNLEATVSKVALSAAAALALTLRRHTRPELSPPPSPVAASPAQPESLPPASPVWHHEACSNPCLGTSDCAALNHLLTCDELFELSCDCDGCCTARLSGPPPSQPPSLPPASPVWHHEACSNPCLGTSDCAALNHLLTCGELFELGCDCDGCCD